MAPAAHGELEAAYRNDARRVYATLIRLLGGFQAAEEGVHEAFLAAAAAWPQTGVPANPYAWLVSAGRNRVVDRWRRDARVKGACADMPAEPDWTDDPDPHAIRDDDLSLIFICCHPALSPDGRAALTLREVCGLTTEEIARAFLTPAPTIAQRIVRAKAKIRDLAIPYEVPGRAEWPVRLDSVLQVIYLVFNEGHTTTDGPQLIRTDLCGEAIRLGRLLNDLVDDAEALGLLALMLLHDARRATRIDAAGDFVPLEEQDRSRWDRTLIAEAQGLIARALTHRRVGPYILQAAIAELHAGAPGLAETDWPQIVGLYDTLMRVAPSPVVALNRAVAIGQRDGAETGLAAVEAAMAGGGLDTYHLAFAAAAGLHHQCGRIATAIALYRQGLDLAVQSADRRFLERRMAELLDVDRRMPDPGRH
ncbi:RNA polymerase sigma factor [Bradyrhizobium sp. U87765 SZCCT0131]|uniref:RNA polymerase sigma factor n=1 Tax=unclassified Bradyrhizobium TaxID=2631580 RepID=UPI001BA57229|nr:MULTISPECIES: RNA polymerase sigma factor [unclassified Bradyrhizobium]MBR1217120.1 RNA polymerase sigma factor [Bradyrhizobium sp. U87765 SZCCT0131]MBR1259124.1 RNA polymerase sigma factor [Bradyrhizobium sp. U87765 SZCCT0134]MBR1305265.1 RNA polymerase sigma factor [Bradyrhizobium sp. U87765 SZCCT0110]MBR1321051.1 RNA polymerase sigma factor [Bradyrhizobium sp. U87765 SZCCT0109]MBR1350295.1 RNA polymerase sigma factor [Bradyrhizobium sp. U87765 SZCCT0048]